MSLLSWIFGRLRLSTALRVGRALGWLWYRVVPIRVEVAMANLAIAFPGLSTPEKKRIVQATLSQLTQSAVELLWLPGVGREELARWVEHAGWQHYEAAMAQGRGVILVSGHFGNFDLMACVEAVQGMPLSVVTRTLAMKGVNRFWMALRQQHGLGLLPPRDSILRIHRLLRGGQAVAMAIDQHMPAGKGIVVPFFGRPASTTPAPATVSLLTGAPILPVTIHRLPDGRHRVEMEPPLFPSSSLADRHSEVIRLTVALNQWLEAKVRARPDHWLWVHRRWKVPEQKAAQ